MNAESLSDLTPEAIAQHIADQLAALPQVTAVVLSGSRTATRADALSDIDLYVYTDTPIPAADRRTIGLRYSDNPQIDNRFWEDGDEWIVQQSGLPVDIMYRSPRWIEEQLDRLLVQHQASVGFSTCFWFNVRHCHTLYDRDGWFAALQGKAAQPYSDELKHAVIAKNYPVLRTLEHSAYSHQVRTAVARQDLVNLQSRITAILASYFDILFAVNKQLNPGEKRLIAYAQQLADMPPSFADHIQALILSVCVPDQAVPALDHLLDGLDALLEQKGLALSL